MAFKKKTNSFAKLAEALEKDGNSGYSDDKNLWKPTQDKSGNGFAVIRFLPAFGDEELPYAKLYSHGFKNGGKWFIENCPTTLDSGRDACPVCQANTELWSTGEKANKDLASNRRRQLYYYSNILVISDPGKPDNEGKVFLYRYGKTIFDMIKGAIKPVFQDETPIEPFCHEDGANFKLKVTGKGRDTSYEKSSFESKSLLCDGDGAQQDKIIEKMVSLDELIAPDQFKSTADLQKQFDRVNGKVVVRQSIDDSTGTTPDNPNDYASKQTAPKSKSKFGSKTPADTPIDDDIPDFDTPEKAEAVKTEKPKAEKPKAEKASQPATSSPSQDDDEDDDDEAYFKSLLED